MTDALTRLLSTRDWLMADGATGTNLFNMGLSSGDAPEMWNVEHPDSIRALYKSAVDAGSDIFLTNSFGGNASRLKLHSAQGRVRELNRVAASTRSRDGRCGGPDGGRRRLDGSDRRDLRADGHDDPCHCRRDVPRTGRGAEGGRRRRALGRDDLGPRGIPRRRRGRRPRRHALVRHDELRHRRAHDDGRHLGGDGRHGGKAAQPAHRLRRELRRRGIRPAAHRAGLCRARPGTADHRQGQCGHPEVSRRPHPL